MSRPLLANRPLNVAEVCGGGAMAQNRKAKHHSPTCFAPSNDTPLPRYLPDERWKIVPNL